MPNKAQSATRAAHWRPLVETWRRSGQTQKAFCQAHDLSYDKFVYWRRKLSHNGGGRRRRPSSALVPVSFAPKAAAPGLSLVLPNGLELRGLTLDNVAVVERLLGHLS